MRFTVDKQKIITLDVEDRIDLLCPDQKELNRQETLEVYQRFVYPELEKQIAVYLPIE